MTGPCRNAAGAGASADRTSRGSLFTPWGAAIAVTALLALMAGSAAAQQPSRGNADPAADARAIRAALEQWPQDWNARITAAVCALFAPDVVLIFGGGPDRSYDVMCKGFAALFARADRTIRYDRPAIAEILVDGDLATVRLVWTARTTGAQIDGELVERENGLDVFRRQPDGRWRIHISHAVPVE